MTFKFVNDKSDPSFIPYHLRQAHILSTRGNEAILDDFDKALDIQPVLGDYLSFFTARNVGDILVNVFFGLSIEKALKLVNVPLGIFLQWKSHGLRQNGLIRRFFLALDTAQVEFELTHVKNLSLQSTLDAKTSLLLLERTRDSYAPKSYVQVSVIEGDIMNDLKGLVSSGAMSVDEIVEEIGQLDEQQTTYLYGIEHQRIRALESSNAKSKDKYLVQ